MEYKLGDLVEPVTETNSNLEYGLDDIIGVTLDKQIIPTIANLKETDLSKFTIVSPNDFVYNPRTHGKKIGLGYNKTNNKYLATWNNNTFRIKAEKKDTILSDYLYMYFNREIWDKEACFNSWGSSTVVFSWDSFCDMKINLPDIEEQRKIVKEYQTIQNRIKLLEELNEKLYQVCKYNYINLLQGYSVESENLPTGWHIGTLKDIYTFQYGKGNNNPDNGGEYPIYGGNGIIGGYNNFNNDDAPIIGHIGVNCGSLHYEFGKHFVTYNGIMCNIKNKEYKYWGYITLLNSSLQEQVRGSNQPFISYDMLYEINTVIPNEESIFAFEKIITPVFNTIKNNQKEISLLKNLLSLKTERI